MWTPNAPSIQNFNLSALISPQSVNGDIGQENVNLSLLFSSLTVLKCIRGIYTPANDEPTIYTFGSSESPQFIILLVDQLTNLVMANANVSLIADIPVSRMLCLTMADLGASPVQTIKFDGRTSGPQVNMAQGTPVNYMLAFCRGTIT